MARAKRTDRAEARRRFRQTQVAQSVSPDDTESDDEGVPGRSGRAQASPRADAPTVPGARPGPLSAFRLASARADIRGDLRALPMLLRTRAALVPAALILATAVATFALGQSTYVAALAFQALLAPPPMAASFLAGILAPRGGWILGLLAGIAAGLAFAVVMVLGPDALILALFRASGTIPAGFRERYAVQALAISPVMGLATGAFAGFYRRFLRLATPARGSNARGASRQRRAPARR